MAERVTVYGTEGCGETSRTLRHLDAAGVEYVYIDIDEDDAGERKVIEFNRGKRRVPLVEIASDDGDALCLSVPSSSELDNELTRRERRR